MTRKIKVTGFFKDPAQRPLRGGISFTPLPAYILAPEIDTAFIGKVSYHLKEDGSLEAELIATEGWKYQVNFDLVTQDGVSVDMQQCYLDVSHDAALPDVMGLDISGGATRPVFTYESYGAGELRASGATISPDDPGSILIPAAI